jgi:hypothetical protein
MSGSRAIVTVFGTGDCRDVEGACEQAEAVGRVLARLGYAVANGGYGGTMEASARGAKAAGGRTIGVVCDVWDGRPNRWIDEVVTTSDLMHRLRTLVDLGTAGYVVLPGATGTLVELAVVWETMSKRLAPRRALVCVGGFWRPLVELMSSARPACADYVTVIDRAEELERFLPPA